MTTKTKDGKIKFIAPPIKEQTDKKILEQFKSFRKKGWLFCAIIILFYRNHPYLNIYKGD